jgi:integrase/recombinase XerD
VTRHILQREWVGVLPASETCGAYAECGIRHRFAVQTLVRWYRKGEEVERRLPILSTYLGHAHLTDTYWCLTSIPELLGAAGKRMEKRWGGGVLRMAQTREAG